MNKNTALASPATPWNVLPWSPAGDISRLYNAFLGMPHGTAGTTDQWCNAGVELWETPETFRVTAEVPGIDPSAIDMTVSANALTFSGTKAPIEYDGNANLLLGERSYGSFKRTVTLPQTIDPEKVTATYENGIVCIELCKVAESQGRTITIQSKG